MSQTTKEQLEELRRYVALRDRPMLTSRHRNMVKALLADAERLEKCEQALRDIVAFQQSAYGPDANETTIYLLADDALGANPCRP